MSDFEVRGAEDFFRASKALKAAGETEMRRGLNTALRKAAKPLIVKTREAARKNLPHGGGLADSVAKASQRVQVRTGEGTAGVRIVASGPVVGANRGKVRHPVFGNREVFVEQQVEGGWFDDTLRDSADEVMPAIEEAVKTVLDHIAEKG